MGTSSPAALSPGVDLKCNCGTEEELLVDMQTMCSVAGDLEYTSKYLVNYMMTAIQLDVCKAIRNLFYICH